jgi:hypothetical protein
MKEVIGIADPYVDEYYDTKVRYGGVYRYRIRSILRWTRPKNITVTGKDPTQASPMFLGLAEQKDSSHSTSLNLTPNFCGYFGSEWNKNWATAHIIDEIPPNPPDQLNVRPYSKNNCIIVTFNIPDNSQRDIYKMSLYRRRIDERGNDIDNGDWIKLADFDMTANVYFEDTNVTSYPVNKGRYIYAATATSIHNGESTLSEQIGARINRDWEVYGELPREFYSSRGVDITTHGIFAINPIKKYKTHVVTVPNNLSFDRSPAEIKLMGQERWGTRVLNGAAYILRLLSLDTGEMVDVEFNTDIITAPTEHINAPNSVYVPSANEQYLYDPTALTSG